MKKTISLLLIQSLLLLLSTTAAFAQEVGVEILDNEPPSDVSNVLAVAGDAEVSLAWDSATDNIAVAGYRLDYGLTSVSERGDTYDISLDVGNVLEYTVTELVNGETYYFGVSAYDEEGNESLRWSVETSATPAEDEEPPSDVENVTTTEEDGNITLAWEAATDNNAVAGYVIQYGLEPVEGSDEEYSNSIDVGDVLEYSFSELVSGEVYYFAVYAYDLAGNESMAYSSEVAQGLGVEIEEEDVEEAEAEASDEALVNAVENDLETDDEALEEESVDGQDESPEDLSSSIDLSSYLDAEDSEYFDADARSQISVQLAENYLGQPKSFLVELTWGDVDKSLQPDVNVTDWSGEIAISGAKLQLQESLRFESQGDKIEENSREKISYESKIHSHYDGLLLKIRPDNENFSLLLDNDYSGKIALDFEDLRKGTVLEFDGGYKLVAKAYNPLSYQKKITRKPALYLIRWGNLDGGLDNNAKPTNYEGAITARGFDLSLAGDLLFEEGDSAVEVSRTEIDINSDISGHWDGILVRLKPITADSDAEEELDSLEDGSIDEKRVEISLGGFTLALATEDDLGVYDLGDGNSLEVLDAFHRAGQRFEKGLSAKIKLINKCERVYEVVREWEAENPGENLKEVSSLCEKMMRYNFDSDTLVKMLDRIEKFVTSLDVAAISREEALGLNAELDARWTGLKESSKLAKFNLGQIPFKDVDDAEEIWYFDYVFNMYKRGIVKGYSDANGVPLGEYRPGNKVTVSQILKIALLAAGHELDAEAAQIPASLADHWAAKHFRKGKVLELSILAGLENLDPERTATRAEVLQLLLEAFEIDVPAAETSIYSDVTASHPLIRFVNYASEIGLVSGDAGVNTFRPDEGLNRAELAKVVNNALAILGE